MNVSGCGEDLLGEKEKRVCTAQPDSSGGHTQTHTQKSAVSLSQAAYVIQHLDAVKSPLSRGTISQFMQPFSAFSSFSLWAVFTGTVLVPATLSPVFCE